MITWTESELEEFDGLTWGVSSQSQVERISSRIAMSEFIKKHGKEKCDAMWAHLNSDKARATGEGEGHD